jgi:DNA polymerase I-like protein with 3'-5' exonuclease and polymerase domains
MVKDYVVLDVETTISNKGNPFDETNKLCYIGIGDQCFAIDIGSSPYRMRLDSVQSCIDQSKLLVGFNIKFDLHWIKRYGINFSDKRIWDCQLVHFILTGQRESYPSLNDVAQYYGLGSKLDVVASEYWSAGIDTPDIPKDILEEYLMQDLKLTEQIYLKQLEQVNQSSLQLQRLISLHNQDLLVLQEMEYNGLIYNEQRSKELANELDEQIQSIDRALFEYHNCSEFNPNSVYHLSAFLYGGSIGLRRKEPCGYFKSGSRKGELKEKWVDYQVNFERLVKPLKGTELDKEGFFSTDEPTLRSLKGNKTSKDVIDLLLKRAELDKRVSTYYRGLLELRIKSNWTEGKIHGQLNQCVVRTGRLSSSKPNMQNFDGEIKELFLSRFA